MRLSKLDLEMAQRFGQTGEVIDKIVDQLLAQYFTDLDEMCTASLLTPYGVSVEYHGAGSYTIKVDPEVPSGEIHDKSAVNPMEGL
jgi:hypothetical protein